MEHFIQENVAKKATASSHGHWVRAPSLQEGCPGMAWQYIFFGMVGDLVCNLREIGSYIIIVLVLPHVFPQVKDGLVLPTEGLLANSTEVAKGAPPPQEGPSSWL